MALDYGILIDHIASYLGDNGDYIFEERLEGYPNGTRVKFKIPNKNVDDITVYVDGTEKDMGTDYIFHSDSSIVEFTSAPSVNSDITADYVTYRFNREDITIVIDNAIEYLQSLLGTTISSITSSLRSIIIVAVILELMQNDLFKPESVGMSYSELGTRVSTTNVTRDKTAIIEQTRLRLGNIVTAYQRNNFEYALIETENTLSSLGWNE